MARAARELSDDQWSILENLMPKRNTHGRPWSDHRLILEGIIWVLRTGAPWRDLPERYGPWQTVYERFSRWRKDGTWARIVKTLQKEMNTKEMIDWELFLIDGSVIRATRASAGARQSSEPSEPVDHALGRSCGGFSTKEQLVVDGNGIPLVVDVTPGQRHESTQFEKVLDQVEVQAEGRGRPSKRPEAVGADKGYSVPRIREWLREHGIEAVIPEKADEVERRAKHPGRKPKFDKDKYRRRNVVERCMGWLKEKRRLATRFEKLALNFIGMFQVAFITMYTKLLVG